MIELYKLKPCKSCGGDHCEVQSSDINGNLHYYAKCQMCWARGSRATTPERAAELWNRKPVENTLHGKFD
jgi:hypothetical protein